LARIRVYVTVDEKLVEWMDDLVKRGLFKNRSHVMDMALNHVKQEGIKRILLEKLEEKEQS
jgi:Arc/MetJ-type ribon-helix-helix transcriptional regulator